MVKFYGHHPTEEIADPNAINTTTQEASANAETQANNYTDAQISIIETLVATVSANTLDEANNGWFKENFTMTTITSGASGRPIGVVFDESVAFFKVHVAAFDTAPGAPGDGGAWHLEAAFQKSVPTDARQLGPTIVLFEEKDDALWDVDFGQGGIADEVVEIQVYGTVGTAIVWSVSVEWFMIAP